MSGQLLAGVDAEGVATAALGLIGFIATVVVGVRAGLKKSREVEVDPGMRIAGVSLMDNHSMLQLSEALKENTQAVHQHRDALIENSHQTELLRIRMG